MPSWNDILKETTSSFTTTYDITRRKYLKNLCDYLNRNVIAYYSAWLQKPDIESTEIDDNDINAFMSTIHGLDKNKGLDLILHTPGGRITAAEAIVEYLHEIFSDNIRVIIPLISLKFKFLLK